MAATIITQPIDSSANVGAFHTFNVAAVGTGTLSYEWYVENTPMGVNSPTFSTYQATLNNSYYVVYCEVTDPDDGIITKSDEVLALSRQGGLTADLDDIGDVDTAGVATGDVLSWNGTKWVPIAGDTDFIEKQYRYDGALEAATGTARLYIPAGCSGYSVTPHVENASASGAINLDILINGAIDLPVTIPELATVGAATPSATAISAGSYVTIDITDPGTGASNLYLTLTFTRA